MDEDVGAGVGPSERAHHASGGGPNATARKPGAQYWWQAAQSPSENFELVKGLRAGG